MAVGAAMTGLRPIIEGMNMFLLLAFNQISNNSRCYAIPPGQLQNSDGDRQPWGGVGLATGAEHSQRLEKLLSSSSGSENWLLLPPLQHKGLHSKLPSEMITQFCSLNTFHSTGKENLPEEECLPPG